MLSSLFDKEMTDIKKNITLSYIHLRTCAPILSMAYWYLDGGFFYCPMTCTLYRVCQVPMKRQYITLMQSLQLKCIYSPDVLGFQIAAVIFGSVLIYRNVSDEWYDLLCNKWFDH